MQSALYNTVRTLLAHYMNASLCNTWHANYVKQTRVILSSWKNFRRVTNIRLTDVKYTRVLEKSNFLWNKGISIVLHHPNSLRCNNLKIFFNRFYDWILRWYLDKSRQGKVSNADQSLIYYSQAWLITTERLGFSYIRSSVSNPW